MTDQEWKAAMKRPLGSFTEESWAELQQETHRRINDLVPQTDQPATKDLPNEKVYRVV